MQISRRAACHASVTWCVLVVLGVAGCSPAYRFQYDYALVSPAAGGEGLENEQVRIHLVPEPRTGIMQLSITNKTSQPIAIVWGQTHFVNPDGRRQQATAVEAAWYFRSAETTEIAPKDTIRLRVQAGQQLRSYNPITVTRSSSGAISASTAPQALLPTSGKTVTVGTRLKGQEFRFVLALRGDSEVTQYPFTFRITEVAVQ